MFGFERGQTDSNKMLLRTFPFRKAHNFMSFTQKINDQHRQATRHSLQTVWRVNDRTACARLQQLYDAGHKVRVKAVEYRCAHSLTCDLCYTHQPIQIGIISEHVRSPSLQQLRSTWKHMFTAHVHCASQLVRENS